ncbi:hypothetical protein HDV00_005235 [Rhizophlyctis rosea]|nr:hypothetical protein HDV00_005235 [Rhizophlyctis rosea]
MTDVQEVTKELQTRPHPSDAKAMGLAKMSGEDVTGVLMGIKAALVAKGVCAEEDYEGLVKAHVQEMLEMDHVVYWTRCFGRKEL